MRTLSASLLSRGGCLLSVLSSPLWLMACAAEPPPPAVAVPPVAAAPPAPPPAATEPYLKVRLTPRAEGTPHVHVDMELGIVRPQESFRLALGAPENLTHVVMSDGGGAVDVKLSADRGGVLLAPLRSPSGIVRLGYDVAANTESAFKPLATRVLDDRFVGSGETLLLLPDHSGDEAIPVEIGIDGSALRAPNAASTLGVGATHRAKLRAASLVGVTFVAGSMGASVFDAIEGHDEAAWLGYTAFDPRPAAAEVAQVRTAMAEIFHAQSPPPSTLLFVTQTRPLGSYTTTSRLGGTLLQLGPSEPWSAPLRISIGQQLVRPWLGRELSIAPRDAYHPAESYWFTEGVARFFVTRLLARVGLIHPDDVRDALVGEISVILASGHQGKSNGALAEIASTDPTARAHLAARGALYAARVNALLRDKSKGASSLDALILDLLSRARKEQQSLPASAWGEAVSRLVAPAEGPQFERTIDAGEEVVLPKSVLGHCYRAGTGDYVTFDLGFDAAATREAKTGEVVGLRTDGPAARAGLKPGDIVEADYRDGHPEVPVKLTVERGAETLHLTYEARGARHVGPTWTRLPATPDERCDDAF